MDVTSIRNNQFNMLASRSGYNRALRHFRMAQELAADVGDGFNLADVLNAALKADRIEESQIRALVSLLAEKYEYVFKSENLVNKIESVKNIHDVIASWTNIQVIIIYENANNEVHLLNPENPDVWESVLPLKKDEHVLCCVGSLEKTQPNILKSALSDVFALLYGRKVGSKVSYRASKTLKRFEAKVKVRETPPVSANNQTPSTGKAEPSSVGTSRKLTRQIAVNVTNELFHNGNVEAWKRVIQSYKLKYPGLDVLIWYEGERINDINALFKWGKVKHGVPIMFSVAGESPKDISKLRKYLFEGASSRFEAFLHGAPGTVLHLF